MAINVAMLRTKIGYITNDIAMNDAKKYALLFREFNIRCSNIIIVMNICICTHSEHLNIHNVASWISQCAHRVWLYTSNTKYSYLINYDIYLLLNKYFSVC